MAGSATPPTRAYRYLRNQLGSLRKVYIRGNRISRRGDLGQRKETVLLLHGFMQTRAVWEVMEDRLRYEGYGVFSFDLGGLFYRFNTRPIPLLAEQVAKKVDGIAERYDLGRFHIVGHSKGGLVARHYIQHHGGDRRVLSLTTLGTPHQGTPTALLGMAILGGGLATRSVFQMLPGSKLVKGLQRRPFPAQIPLSSVYSRHDLVCPHWCAVLPEGHGDRTNIQVKGVGHTALCHDAEVYKHVRARLDYASGLWEQREG